MIKIFLSENFRIFCYQQCWTRRKRLCFEKGQVRNNKTRQKRKEGEHLHTNCQIPTKQRYTKYFLRRWRQGSSQSRDILEEPAGFSAHSIYKLAVALGEHAFAEVTVNLLSRLGDKVLWCPGFVLFCTFLAQSSLLIFNGGFLVWSSHIVASSQCFSDLMPDTTGFKRTLFFNGRDVRYRLFKTGKIQKWFLWTLVLGDRWLSGPLSLDNGRSCKCIAGYWCLEMVEFTRDPSLGGIFNGSKVSAGWLDIRCAIKFNVGCLKTL